MIYLITYWIASVIAETINFYFAWKKFNSGAKNNYIVKAFIDVLNTSESGKKLKKDFINPFTIFIAVVCFVVACPFIFMITVWGWTKKLIGYKSEADKAVEAEKKAFEESKKKSEEFMRTEGSSDSPKEPIDFSPEPQQFISPEQAAQKLNDMNNNANIII